jgi:hypothetical protein
MLKFTISKKQRDVLHGFYMHIWGVIHDAAEKDFGFYAKKLDEMGVSWAIQNIVAGIADERNSIHFYFNTMLQKKGIELENNTLVSVPNNDDVRVSA